MGSSKRRSKRVVLVVHGHQELKDFLLRFSVNREHLTAL